MSNLLLPAFTHAPEVNKVYHTDALTLLKAMDSESVNCVVTSPPYFGLRDYGADGQIGLEPTPREYVEALRKVFAECRRVLRNDGTLWLNLGDSYATSGGNRKGGLEGMEADGVRKGGFKPQGFVNKSLIGIPWRAAFALQDDGWILRDEIIWHKPNPMPASVTDRTTRAHEQVFMFSKSQRYYYDQDAIKEPAKNWGERDRSNGKYTSGDAPIKGGVHTGLKGTAKQSQLGKRTYTGFNERWDAQAEEPLFRNRRSVWTVSTVGFPGSHFATFPEDLITPMILAGCPKGGVVYDPFFGAGTTGLVAQKLNRNWIGSAVNAEYVELARYRIQGRLDEYLAMKAGEPYTPSMFELEVTA